MRSIVVLRKKEKTAIGVLKDHKSKLIQKIAVNASSYSTLLHIFKFPQAFKESCHNNRENLLHK